MSRWAYVNGRFVRHAEGAVHIEDRGYQFGDSVYEVVPILKGKLIDMMPHVNRLERSLSELKINLHYSRHVMLILFKEMAKRNKIRNGLVYLQITRGVAPRGHAFPDPEVLPSIVMTAKNINFTDKMLKAQHSIKALTENDIRWQRCDIKTTNLLPNCLANERAKQAGAGEMILVDAEGMVTEASHSNLWIVNSQGELMTRPISYDILPGCTRLGIIQVANNHGFKVVEQRFSVQEMMDAREVFVSGATSFVTPVVNIDGQDISDGKPGVLSQKLMAAFLPWLEEQAVKVA